MNNPQINIDFLRERIQQLKFEISKKIIGQNIIIDQLLMAILARGHALMIGVPGLAKTLLVSTIAEAIDLKFNRIQFTPDLMPSDIMGTEILEENTETRLRSFKYIKGPIFAGIVLADEINRTPPKTQSALLEAMQEGKVTSGGVRYDLPNPFFILATQNPIEQEGTYPLPEAQTDRFMFSLFLDYPSQQEEIDIVKTTVSNQNVPIEKILNINQILELQKLVREIPVSDNVVNYSVNLVRHTRPSTTNNELVKKYVSWGAGPRASQYLILAAKAYCVLHGKNTPSIDDIHQIVFPVLQHRIITGFAAEAENITTKNIIESLLLKQ